MSTELTYFEAVVFFPYALTNLALMLIAQFLKLNEAENYLQSNAQIVNEREKWRSLHAAGRSARFSDVAHLLMFPKRSIRKGRITQQELDAMPKRLRFWMTAPMFLGYPLLTWGVIRTAIDAWV